MCFLSKNKKFLRKTIHLTHGFLRLLENFLNDFHQAVEDIRWQPRKRRKLSGFSSMFRNKTSIKVGNVYFGKTNYYENYRMTPGHSIFESVMAWQHIKGEALVKLWHWARLSWLHEHLFSGKFMFQLFPTQKTNPARARRRRRKKNKQPRDWEERSEHK